MSRVMPRADRANLGLALASFALGVVLRGWRLDAGWFGVDQARDVQTALDVAAGRDWPTVGPTMRRVTRLGALYHYVWAIPHLVSADPLAAYAFAAGLGVLALGLTWAFARRHFGPGAALVALAVLATSPVAVIDARVAWAPAALPATATAVLCLLAGAPTPGRLAALGVLLGVAVQLHLAMVAWVAAAVLLLVVRRPPARAVGAGALGLLVTGWPALWAALANVGDDAGLSTLPARGPFPNAASRLVAALALAWRVPAALWEWPGSSAAWPVAFRVAGAVIAACMVAGVLRLARAGARHAWPATVILTTLVFQVAAVALLPGEAWYYYLDAALPAGALAAGFLWATPGGAAPRGVSSAAAAAPPGSPARVSAPVDPSPSGAGSRARRLAVAVPLLAAAVLGVHLVYWIAVGSRTGYLVVRPAGLALDGAGGRDAARPGRLLTVGSKRALAALLATDPADFPTRWRTTHGPAFDDATGDNGFWLRRASVPEGAAAPSSGTGARPGADAAFPADGTWPRHAALWYRDDPTAPAAAAPGFRVDAVGPLVVARYQPAILYASCRAADGPVAVPIRVMPHPRRYGDGTVARPTRLPARVTCAVAAGEGATRVVAAVGAGTVALRDEAGGGPPPAPSSTLCVVRSAQPVTFSIEVDVAADTAADLDLYERPDPACAAEIAP